MHAFVTSKNVKWCHLIWPTLYMDQCVIPVVIFPQIETNGFCKSIISMWLLQVEVFALWYAAIWCLLTSDICWKLLLCYIFIDVSFRSRNIRSVQYIYDLYNHNILYGVVWVLWLITATDHNWSKLAAVSWEKKNCSSCDVLQDQLSSGCHYHASGVKMSSSPSRTENSLTYVIPASRCDTICTHTSQELFVNGISCHNLLFYSVLLRHLGVHCHLSNLDLGAPLHCRAVNGSRVPSRRSQKFASILTTCTDTDFI